MKRANNLILCLLLSAISLPGCVSKEEFTKRRACRANRRINSGKTVSRPKSRPSR